MKKIKIKNTATLLSDLGLNENKYIQIDEERTHSFVLNCDVNPVAIKYTSDSASDILAKFSYPTGEVNLFQLVRHLRNVAAIKEALFKKPLWRFNPSRRLEYINAPINGIGWNYENN